MIRSVPRQGALPQVLVRRGIRRVAREDVLIGGDRRIGRALFLVQRSEIEFGGGEIRSNRQRAPV